MRKFFITIGRDRHAPRIAQEVYAENQQRAGEQADDLAELGERVEVTPVPTESELLAADVRGNVDKAQRRHQCEDWRALQDQVQWMRCVGAL